MAVGSPNSPSYAEDGTAYPDSADISFSRTVIGDTVTILLTNLSADAVQNLFISDFTVQPTILLGCIRDGQPFEIPAIEREFGSVYANKITTRWLIGDFSQTLILRYYSLGYNSYELGWSGAHPYAVFGILPPRIMGPPTDVGWQQ